MVAKIVTGKSIRGILRYNETKVSEGQAQLIMASGFASDIEKLSFQNKVNRFNHLTILKPSVKTNALHITLNFDASEKISNEKMQQIAMTYMEGIGFSEQPYLVYRHNDSAHQHVHIATTSIRRNGESINLHNIGRILSEPVRKKIEKEFDLVVAEQKKYKPSPLIAPIDLKTIQYGHIPTKRAIGQVVTAVINNYSFTSLPELNAVLGLFNVIADRGPEGSDMFKNKGLIYSIQDRKGNKAGVPIKASEFYNKPILDKLEKLFELNKEKRKPHHEAVKNKIDKVLSRYSAITMHTFHAELKRTGVDVILRRNEQGFIYGATFIDHQSKSVFNGSALGKAYSAKQLTERLSTSDKLKTYLTPLPASKISIKQPMAQQSKSYLKPVNETNYLEGLLGKPQGDFGSSVPKKKKRRRKGRTL